LTWFQIKKWSTTKFHNFLRSTTFILVVSSSEVIWKIQISNLRNSNVVFLGKLNSNEKVVNYKVVLLLKICNFCFCCLSIRGHLKNSNFKFLKIKIFFHDKMISNQKVVTTKFHNFLRSTTFILVVSPSEVVWKIQISNLRNSNVVFLGKMNSNGKVANYKVV
jgi:hypothetical protein